MRKWACFQEPVSYHGVMIRKVMFYQIPSGETYVFLYGKENAQISSADEWYPSLMDAHSAWDVIPHSDWIEIGDPVPGCQEDAADPVRVKGRVEGKPEWGRYEILCNGVWKDYKE